MLVPLPAAINAHEFNALTIQKVMTDMCNNLHHLADEESVEIDLPTVISSQDMTTERFVSILNKLLVALEVIEAAVE